MVLSLGVYYSRYQATSELERDSPEPAGERVRRYRACAGWALVTGKYMQPGPWTLGAVVLYLGSHLHLNRATQMSSYVLSGVCIRLMLKMGLHRDPSRLAGISAFEGEMRRRLWNQAIVLETLVSFHVGLPGMASLIDADAELPRNLQDDDLDEDMVELPPSRPPGDWTPVTYAAVKRTIMDVFGHISREAHALSPPEYGDVMRLDADLQAAWARVPPVMRVRSVDESIGDPPALIVQRFGIASLYNKSRCVLHRRYLAEGAGSTSGAPGAKPPLRQHDYSRQQCLDAAVSLLRSQSLIWKLSGPGNTLAAHRWFVSSLSVHDFLLAAMVVYYIIQSEHYENPDSPVVWVAPGGSGSGGGSGSDGGNGIKEAPSKDELRGLIYTSYLVWSDLAESSAEVRRTADTLALILARLGTPVEGHQSQQARKNASTAPTVLVSADAAASAGVSSVGSNGAWSTPDFDASGASSDAVGTSSLHGPVSNISLNGGWSDTLVVL